MFILQKHTLNFVHRSVIPSPHGSCFSASIPLPDFHSFGWPIFGPESLGKDRPPTTNQRAMIIKKFREFSSPLIDEGISIYTDGSKSDDSPVGVAIYSPELCIALKHKLSSDTSIFSVEVWAIYQARIRLEIRIEIGLEFNQSEERKPISSLVNSALIGQNPIQSHS